MRLQSLCLFIVALASATCAANALDHIRPYKGVILGELATFLAGCALTTESEALRRSLYGLSALSSATAAAVFGKAVCDDVKRPNVGFRTFLLRKTIRNHRLGRLAVMAAIVVAVEWTSFVKARQKKDVLLVFASLCAEIVFPHTFSGFERAAMRQKKRG